MRPSHNCTLKKQRVAKRTPYQIRLRIREPEAVDNDIFCCQNQQSYSKPPQASDAVNNDVDLVLGEALFQQRSINIWS